MPFLHIFTQFKKDYKRAKKQGRPVEELKVVVRKLTRGERLAAKHKDHSLKGSFKKEHRECHIRPDWLLIYRIEEDALVLVRSGTHSDLFE